MKKTPLVTVTLPEDTGTKRQRVKWERIIGEELSLVIEENVSVAAEAREVLMERMRESFGVPYTQDELTGFTGKSEVNKTFVSAQKELETRVSPHISKP